MKEKFSILFILLITACFSQNVTIPDTNFKTALISSNCVDADLNNTYESDADLNNDGEIQVSEAAIIQRLKVSNKSISDLTGIESFSNLKKLLCNNNLLTTVSFTSNTALQQIDCYSNSFVNLTISGFPQLTALNVSPNNSLQNITVTNNTALATLGVGSIASLISINCSNNALTSLNLNYPFSNLTSLNCSNNQITSSSLNLGNSIPNLNNLNISNNLLTTGFFISSLSSSIVTLNLSNNLLTNLTFGLPNLANLSLGGNPLTALNFNSFSNNPLNISNLPSLQTLYFCVTVPSITLSSLPNLTFINVFNSQIQSQLDLANLPSLNSIRFQCPTSDLRIGENLGLTAIIYGFNIPNGLDIQANSLHLNSISNITSIDNYSFNVKNITVDNIPTLTTLKFPVNGNLQSITINNLPQLHDLEIGQYSNNYNTTCINLTLENLNNLTNLSINNLKYDTLNLNNLPALSSFTIRGESCSTTTSNFTLTNLPLLHTVKVLDENLATLNINNLNSLYDLEIYSLKFISINLNTLPQLHDFKYTEMASYANVVLPQLNIQNLPNLYSIYLSRMNMAALNLSNLPNLYSFICTNDYVSGMYEPTQLDYVFNNLPSLNYIQLDQIETTNLSMTNLPNLNMIKMRDSNIGGNYTFQNIPVESIFLEYMTTLNNLNFINLPNIKNLNLIDFPIISSLNLNNIKASLQNFVLQTVNYINPGSITSINFTDFPQLTSIIAEYSLLNMTFSNLPNLTYLNCSKNKFTTLNVANLPQLNTLVCSYTQAPGFQSNFYLNLNLPQLTTLDVNYNNNYLKSLDLSNCPNINDLKFYIDSSMTGEIQYLNLKNGNSTLGAFVSSPIKRICVDDTAEKNLLLSLNSNLGNPIFTTYCSFNPGGIFYTVQGNSRLDLGGDGCDTSDPIFPKINFLINDGTTISNYYGDNSGNYSLPLVAGQYTITPQFENSTYYTFSPASISVDFPLQANPFTQNFCVTPNGNHNDLEVSLISTVPARPGFNSTYKIIYKNKGNQTQSGTIDLTFNDSVLDLISSAPVVSNSGINSLNWNFTNLLPFESREITLILNVNTPTETPAVNGGDVLNYSVQINGLTDEQPNDNNAILNQTVVNAFDPNDKTCSEGIIVSPDLIGEYVHYTVRFENTGTASAINIVVKDIIDAAKFDISTLIPIKGSHNFYTRITNQNQVEFIFQDINLSHLASSNKGYITFKIKTKPTLVVGNSFSNFVDIYFDYNHPIVTNTFVSTFQTLGNDEFELVNAASVLYPNPMTDMVYFTIADKVEKVEVYDVTGRIVSSLSVLDNQVNMQHLSKGNYYLKIYTDTNTLYSKVIKN